MEGYIIHPSFFYLLSVVEGIRGAAIILSVMALIAVGSCTLLVAVYNDFDDDNDDAVNKKMKEIIKYSAIALIVCGLIIIFIPGKRTILEMLIAKYATYSNVQTMFDEVKQIVDYLISNGF